MIVFSVLSLAGQPRGRCTKILVTKSDHHLHTDFLRPVSDFVN